MSFQHLSRIIAMSDVTVKRSKAAEVEDRVRQGVCLLCERQATRRGLCMNHYQTFLRRMSDKGAREDQLQFEASCIREGLVLPAGEMRKLKSDDPFSRV